MLYVASSQEFSGIYIYTQHFAMLVSCVISAPKRITGESHNPELLQRLRASGCHVGSA